MLKTICTRLALPRSAPNITKSIEEQAQLLDRARDLKKMEENEFQRRLQEMKEQ